MRNSSVGMPWGKHQLGYSKWRFSGIIIHFRLFFSHYDTIHGWYIFFFGFPMINHPAMIGTPMETPEWSPLLGNGSFQIDSQMVHHGLLHFFGGSHLGKMGQVIWDTAFEVKGSWEFLCLQVPDFMHDPFESTISRCFLHFQFCFHHFCRSYPFGWWPPPLFCWLLVVMPPFEVVEVTSQI